MITPADSYSLDSRHMEGITYLAHPAPAVYLDSWPMKAVSYLRPHVDWEVLNSKLTLNHVANVKIVDTYASDEVNTDLPESLTPMSTPMMALAWPCVNSPRLPTVKPEIVNRMKDSREVNMTLPESALPMIDPNVSMKNWEDGVCRLLIYSGDCPQDVLKTNSRNPEAANIQHEADEIYTGWTATRTRRWLDMEDNSDTDSVAELEYKTWDDAGAWEFRNARGNTNVNLSQNSPMEMNREYVSDVDTDTDSDAQLDYKAKKCALRAWKFRSAPADVPPADVTPGLIQNPASDMTRSVNMKNGLIENYILRGFILTTSMGMTLWILYNGILLQRIASSQKKAIVCHTRYVMIV